MMRVLGMLGLAIAMALVAAPAQADYPDKGKTIRIVVPYTPGGFNDTLGRIVAQKITDDWGVPAVVDNRPGGGTLIGTDAVAKAPADGYTLLVVAFPFAVNPTLYAKLPYDTVKDFAPVGLVGSAQFALIANKDIGAPTLADLINLVKSKSGQIAYASAGASTPHHLLMEMFLHQIGATAQHVPYRGSVAAMTDVLSGQIPMMVVDLAVAMGPIREGKLKVYGVTSTERVKAMPDLPTLAEAGLPGYGANGWFSVVVAAGTPRPIIDKLNGVLMPYLKQPEVQDRLNAVAITPLTSTPDELAMLIPTEIVKWAKVVKDANIEPQ